MKPINRLRQEYKKYVSIDEDLKDLKKKYLHTYSDMRLFSLDCELVSFNEIELMEFEVDNGSSI